MLVYFVRHAESEANVRKIVSSQDVGIHPLTERGREQAYDLAMQLEGKDFTVAYSSDLLRAVQTTEIILRDRAIPFHTTPLLREHDSGAWEGRSDDEVWEQMHQLFQEWIGGELEAQPQGGESLRDMQRRFTGFLETIFDQHSGTSRPILIVSHAGLYWANLPFLFNNIEFNFMRERGLDNASLIIGEYSDGEWRCINWCGEPLD